MKSENSEVEENIITHKKSPVSRGNYSKCGKLCDQTFYLESENLDIHKKIEYEVRQKSPTRQSTTAFTSIGRQKRGNFRFDIYATRGEFSHHPDFFYGQNKSPKWSFPKKQRYNNVKVEQYEICAKHPIAKRHTEKIMYNSVSNIKETLRSNLKMTKSGSLNETMDETRNYSIVLPRQTSPVGFFNKTKIRNPFYLSKQEIMNEEELLEPSDDIEPCPKGYIQFSKKRPRQRNPVVKGFEIYLPNYSHEKQYNNFSLTHHPTKPEHHIDFDKHLQRKTAVKITQGPNLERLNINPVRKINSNIDLNTKKFKNKIRTRYDRVGPEPNTRLDYGPFEKELGGMVEMDRMLGREDRLRSKNESLQPIVDPAIKKAGDAQMKQTLRKYIKTKQINQALRPRCAQRVKI